MRYAALMLLPFVAAAGACGGGSATTAKAAADASVAASAPPLPADSDIIAKIYDPFYSVPDGFFVDERAGTAQSYTVHHVMDASDSYEVCSDVFATAEAWEAADNASRSVSGYYVGAYENDRYFEFIRELSYEDDVGNVDDLTSPGFARVFKCSNTERDGVDRSLLSGYAGRLNLRPLTAPRVRDFAEYLWQFAFFPQRYRKVLASYPATGTSRPGHTLLLGFASTQGAGRCDLIEVVEWRFLSTPGSGEITSEFSTVRSFEAELADGSPRLCR